MSISVAPGKYRSLPDTPGVYLFKDTEGRVIYVGKAGSLKRRVSSYFERPHDVRIETLVRRIEEIEVRGTDTALEALILEAELIKKLAPRFNVREKDDKSFLYITVTREKFPRVMLSRGRDAAKGSRWGPFVSASSVREALRILRRIFPWSAHDPEGIGNAVRPCLDYEIGLCPGTCVGTADRREYGRNIARLKLFLGGKKARVIRSVEKEMEAASRTLDFERAEKLRRQAFALRHIRDTALIGDSEVALAADRASGSGATPYRIEGYDISNISGTSAVGSMVVFEDGRPNKDEYRKFKIRGVSGPNDVGMLSEVLKRRFRRGAGAHDWRLPDLVLVDGGIPQVNAARKVLREKGLDIPIVGMAKGPDRKRTDILGPLPKGVKRSTLVGVRDEAHRFAISYHKKLRALRSLG